jgi:hypothetical protein
MQLFNPGRILFYGGPLHGRIKYVHGDERTISVLTSPKMDYLVSATEHVNFVMQTAHTYEVKMIRSLKFDILPGLPVAVKNTQHSGYAMVSTSKEYESAKVWRMMERYKVIPGYKAVSWYVPQN